MNHREPSFTKIFSFNNLPQQKQVTFQLWLTYRSCSIDDCCHCGQGSCIPFQTFMGTLKWQRLLRTILSWTQKKSLQCPHLFVWDVHCEVAENILAQILLSLPKETLHPIKWLPTVFSFIQSVCLNNSCEAFSSAHCGFKQQGQHYRFALCCKTVSMAIFSSTNKATLCRTEKVLLWQEY